eukprot:6182952-Pleurochrysis_carterae.AAC.1
MRPIFTVRIRKAASTSGYTPATEDERDLETGSPELPPDLARHSLSVATCCRAGHGPADEGR